MRTLSETHKENGILVAAHRGTFHRSCDQHFRPQKQPWHIIRHHQAESDHRRRQKPRYQNRRLEQLIQLLLSFRNNPCYRHANNSDRCCCQQWVYDTDKQDSVFLQNDQGGVYRVGCQHGRGGEGNGSKAVLYDKTINTTVYTNDIACASTVAVSSVADFITIPSGWNDGCIYFSYRKRAGPYWQTYSYWDADDQRDSGAEEMQCGSDSCHSLLFYFS